MEAANVEQIYAVPREETKEGVFSQRSPVAAVRYTGTKCSEKLHQVDSHLMC